MSEAKSYKEALERIESIVSTIENDQPGVDELTKLVQEATDLILACKENLSNAETNLSATLEKLN